MNATTHVKVTKSRVKQDTRPRVSRARRVNSPYYG